MPNIEYYTDSAVVFDNYTIITRNLFDVKGSTGIIFKSKSEYDNYIDNLIAKVQYDFQIEKLIAAKNRYDEAFFENNALILSKTITRPSGLIKLSLGKLENGVLKHGETYTIMPNKLKIEVDWLFDTEERGVPYAKPGESVRIRCKGVDNENEVTRGNVLCSNDDLCAIFNVFEAEIQVLELQEQQIIANGFKCILHFHTYIEECTIDIKCEIDRQKKTEKKVKFVRSQARIKAFVKTNNPLCGEKYERFPQLGRFSMRFEGMTIAIGKILKYKPYTK
jgi:translation elongation factor EF-1alpha